MRKKIYLIQGMPVEMPLLDSEGEAARERLNELARETYVRTGKLGGLVLREACDEFSRMAPSHLLEEDEPGGKH